MYTYKDQSDPKQAVDQLLFSISNNNTIRYGVADETEPQLKMHHRVLRPVGVATEIYNQITDTLSVQCTNVNGRFVERQFIKENVYGQNNICLWSPQTNTYADYGPVTTNYGILTNEDMCPRDYNLNVDSYFWGACLCWENGGRRSRNGKNATCVAELHDSGDEHKTLNGVPNPSIPPARFVRLTIRPRPNPLKKLLYAVNRVLMPI